MDLAASTAVVERVDLFLQTRELRPRLMPSDLCPNCHKRMSLQALQTTTELEEHTFRCRNCGSEHTRRFRADGFLSCWRSSGGVAMIGTDLSDIYRGYIACLNKRDWPRLEKFVHDEVHYNGRRVGI